ncbi:MAG: transcription antitermination factor NusB [Microbacteriaceae bacterium]|nr:transcription antitermination factor NusB [Microbacteriaceae bacterium]
MTERNFAGKGSNNPKNASSGRRNGSNQAHTLEKRRTRVSETRVVAYDILRDVADRDAYANLALPAKLAQRGIAGREAALATELVAGTLRNQGRYDAIIAIAAKRPAEQIDPRTLRVLRLGAHQLLGMRTAAHAAINESVELQRIVSNAKATGFVNGVLRTISGQTAEEWLTQVAAAQQPNHDAALAACHSHPEWIVRALRDALTKDGRDTEFETMLAANNESPRVHLVVLPQPGRSNSELVQQALDALPDNLTAGGVSPLGLELQGLAPAVAIEKLSQAGVVARVQDQGSQLAALALSRVAPVGKDEKWLDLCAGPGGKTALLAAEAAGCGARVRANEVAPHRADLVERAVIDNADVVDVVSFDGTTDEAFGGENFDRILVDAPCSGLGALRRRPEARWRKQPSDIPELVRLQEKLLAAAVAHLRPGGFLAYVTCSPHLAETKAVVIRLLRKHAELESLDTAKTLREISPNIALSQTGDAAQLWPHAHGTDAMFIALFRRAK